MTQDLSDFFPGRRDRSADCDAEEDRDESRQPGAQRRPEGQGERGADGHLRRAHRKSRLIVKHSPLIEIRRQAKKLFGRAKNSKVWLKERFF